MLCKDNRVCDIQVSTCYPLMYKCLFVIRKVIRFINYIFILVGVYIFAITDCKCLSISSTS